MMKILLVEDDLFKKEQILLHLQNMEECLVKHSKSLNSALREITRNKFDVVLLDMSLPTFDIDDSENFNSYGGLKFLEEMKRKRIITPVIVITQYEIIGEGKYQKSSADIDNECQKKYDNYYGMIIYSSSDNKWKDKLKKSVGELKKNESINS